MKCDILGLLSVLLPTEVTAETMAQFPLLDALSKMIIKLLRDWNLSRGGNVNSALEADSDIIKVSSMKTVLMGRPIQVDTTTIDVDPISNLKHHESWGVNEVIIIESGMSFFNLRNALKDAKITLPKELMMFMEKCDIISKTLVVITDCPKKPQISETQTSEDLDMMPRLSHITFMHRSQLTWFVPTDGFLKVLPKEDVLNLKESRTQFFEISKDVRLNIKAPIERSLEYEFKRIRLFSKEPNMVYEVTLTSGKILYVDASLMPSDWIKVLALGTFDITVLCFRISWHLFWNGQEPYLDMI